MSSENSETITKQSLDKYLNELSKEYKKLGGRKTPVEIILIGGAAIIGNYGFRDMTTDVDAILPAVSIMQEAIKRVAEKYNLPDNWLNSDFMATGSYSHKLTQYSEPYKTFNQILNVRTVAGEYLIAMKLRAGRKYKNDLSDVVGILSEREETGFPISYEMINSAVQNLYGGWEQFAPYSVSFIQGILAAGNYSATYEQFKKSEADAKSLLLDFQADYPNVLKENNLNNILENQAKASDKASVLALLEGMAATQEEAQK